MSERETKSYQVGDRVIITRGHLRGRAGTISGVSAGQIPLHYVDTDIPTCDTRPFKASALKPE